LATRTAALFFFSLRSLTLSCSRCIPPPQDPSCPPPSPPTPPDPALSAAVSVSRDFGNSPRPLWAYFSFRQDSFLLFFSIRHSFCENPPFPPQFAALLLLEKDLLFSLLRDDPVPPPPYTCLLFFRNGFPFLRGWKQTAVSHH